MSSKKTYLVLLLLSFFFYVSAQITNTWEGDVSTDWANGMNWSRGSTPSTGEDVVIEKTGHSSCILSSGTYTVNSVVIKDKNTLQISGGTLNVNNNVTNGDDPAIPIGSFLTVSGGTLNISGDYLCTYDGNTTVSSGQLLVAGNWNSDNDGNQAEGMVTLSGGTVDINGHAQFDATNLAFELSGAVFNLAQNFDINGNLFTMTSGSVNFDGSSTQTVTGTGTLALTDASIAAGSAVTMSRASTVSGAFTISSTSSSTGSLMLGSGGSLGNITYDMYMTGVDKWHVIGAPVSGQAISSFLTSGSNSLAYNNPNYAMSDYDESNDQWNSYYQSSQSGNFTSGKGYEILRSANGTVSFTGSVPTSDVSVSITRSGNGWNCLANPYPSANYATTSGHATNNLLSLNSSNLDPSFAALYVWDPTTSAYLTISNSGGTLSQNSISPGQGFFARSKSGGGTFSFDQDVRHHGTVFVLKSDPEPWPSINLVAQSEENKSSTQITFNENMTRGLDVTFDAGMFKVNPNFALYSRLIEDNGVDFAIQCLPEEYTDLVIPIGLDATAGDVVTFHAENDALPESCTVYLEDLVAKTYTKLDESNKQYTVQITDSHIGVGAFFIHTSLNTLGIEKESLLNEPAIIVDRSKKLIQVLGYVPSNTSVRIYSITGQNVYESKLTNTYTNSISLGQLNKGFYILALQNGQNIITKKVAW